MQSISKPGIKAEGELLVRMQHEVASLLDRHNTNFPGAQPVSFARRHLEELTRQDYYVCEKSDGIRYLLYLTSDGDGKEIHYLIDRRNDYWFIPPGALHFPIPKNVEGYHVETLIDGELVIDKLRNGETQAKYLVFDCMVLDGQSLMNRTLDKRIAYFQERIFDPYTALLKAYPEEIPYMHFLVELKSMQVSYGIEMMFREVLPNLPHGNDGLIFTCRMTDYKHGTDQNILKWKPESENSIDFRMRMEFPLIQPDEQDIAEGISDPYPDYDALPTVNLFVGGTGHSDTWYGAMYLEPHEWETLKGLGEPLQDRIVECYMDSAKRWRYMRFRDDKNNPNYISTVDSVIESITDRVTEQDLLAAARGIRDAWKLRAAKAKAESAVVVNAGRKRKAEEQAGGRPSPGPPPRQ